MRMTCSVENCDRESQSKSGGLCGAHKKRLKKHGDILELIPLRVNNIGHKCKILQCERKAEKKNLCPCHYQRLTIYGDINADKPIKTPSSNLDKNCSVESCSKKSKVDGMCQSHYNRFHKGLRGEELEKPIKLSSKKYGTTPCCIEGCQNYAKVKSMCTLHYARVKNNGDPGPVNRQTALAGTRRVVNKRGYVQLAYGKLEHTAVMELFLGRKLKKGEFVHHLNGIRTDNSISNLELWDKSHPPGQRLEDKIAHYRTFLEFHDSQQSSSKLNELSNIGLYGDYDSLCSYNSV